MGIPKGPVISNKESEVLSWESAAVVLPITWKIIRILPACGFVSAIVKGIRSPFSSILKITNCPAWACVAILGASSQKSNVLLDN